MRDVMREDEVMDDVALPAHWDEVYQRTGGQGVSWYQDVPTTSLRTVQSLPGPVVSVVDVGGGASALVDGLLGVGISDVTVLDVSDEGMRIARNRLGDRAGVVQWVVDDVATWEPGRTFDVWHDRAVFHFLTDLGQRAAYVRVLEAAVRRGGYAVVATFAPDGPETCSNLPTVRYSADMLVAALGPSFELVESFGEVHVTPSGAEQPFTWVVLRRVEGNE